MVNVPGSSLDGFERGRVVKCEPSSPALHLRQGQTALEILAGTHPILHVTVDNERRLVVESIETGRKFAVPRGQGVPVGRDAPVVNEGFIGASGKYVSGDHCLLAVTEYDEKDGHPIVQLADSGSTNGTFYQMLVRDSVAQLGVSESGPEKKYLGKYVVEPGDQVEIPLIRGNSNSYDIFDAETGEKIASVLAGSNGIMIVTSEGHRGGNVEFGSPVEIRLSGVAAIREQAAKRALVEIEPLKRKESLPVVFTFEGNASRPIIKNLGTRRFVAKPIPLFRPKGVA